MSGGVLIGVYQCAAVDCVAVHVLLCERGVHEA